MSTTIRCDRCGKVILANDPVYKLLYRDQKQYLKSYDFCQECADDWVEFMKVKKYEIKEDT